MYFYNNSADNSTRRGGKAVRMNRIYERQDRLQLEILENREEKLHFHQDIELLYVIQGSLDVLIEQQTTHMQKEDVLVVNANRQHRLIGSENVMYVKLTVLYDLVSDIAKDLNVIFLCDSTRNSDESYHELRRLLQKLLSHYLATHENAADFTHISLCYQILAFLSEHYLMRKAEKISDTETEKYDERISQIDNYIRANFQSPISIKDLSERLYLSEGHLSRFFKKNYGMSFVEYLTNVRLHHAVDELLYTDLPITRIVYNNGFSSVASFNRAFKKEYNETPSQVRKRNTGEKKNETIKLSKEAAERAADVLWKTIPDEDVSGGEIESSVDTAHKEKYKTYWKEMINIGSAADLLRSEVQEHVMILKRALDFQYVRFWSPFSKELLIDIHVQDGRYNFSRLDSVLDFLIGLEIKPFIELADKPKKLSATTMEPIVQGTSDHSLSREEWRSVMTSFVRHILMRYGEAVNSWKFELWFDVLQLDNEQAVSEYMEHFKTAQAVLHEHTSAMIGAAGLHAITRINETRTVAVKKFFQTMIVKKVIPDFLTLYAYAYDTDKPEDLMARRRSTDPDYLLHETELFQKTRFPELRELPVYITEWNLTVSDRNVINDSCFKGAYIVKNYIDLFGMVDGIAYFSGTDRLSEYYDTNRFLFGGKGLLTCDGIMKPAAFAFDFLNRLYPYYVGKGKNYIVTANGSDHYGIVCHNCKKLNYVYFTTPEDQLDRDHLNQYFEDLDPLTLKLHLKHLKNGTYHVKIYRINVRHGSVQQLWEEMGYENELSRGDIEYFRRVNEPNLSMKNIEVRSGQADLTITMDANEFAFIRLRRRV